MSPIIQSILEQLGLILAILPVVFFNMLFLYDYSFRWHGK